MANDLVNKILAIKNIYESGKVSIEDNGYDVTLTVPKSTTYFRGFNIKKIYLPDTFRYTQETLFGTETKWFNTYDNGLYLGTKNNPYYCLVRVVDGATTCLIHPDTKVLAESSLYDISDISLPDGLKYINNFAIGSLKGMTKFTIPASVVSSGASDYAVEYNYVDDICIGCKTLEELYILSPIKIIGSNCFIDLTSLKKLVLPSSLKNILKKTIFKNCPLTDLTLPYMVNISNFYNYFPSNIENITIDGGDGDTLTWDLSGVTNNIVIKNIDTIGEIDTGGEVLGITFGEGVKRLMNDCVMACEYVKKINISSTVVDIKGDMTNYSFGGLFSLENINVDENNPKYKSENNMLTTKDGKVLIFVAMKRNSDILEIPETVETIASYAIGGISDQGSTMFKKIKVLGDIKEIGDFGLMYSYIGDTCIIEFKNNTQVPIISYNSVPYGTTMVIPDNLYEEWTTATNWVDREITWIKASEYIEE